MHPVVPSWSVLMAVKPCVVMPHDAMMWHDFMTSHDFISHSSSITFYWTPVIDYIHAGEYGHMDGHSFFLDHWAQGCKLLFQKRTTGEKNYFPLHDLWIMWQNHNALYISRMKTSRKSCDQKVVVKRNTILQTCISNCTSLHGHTNVKKRRLHEPDCVYNHQ